MRARPRSVALRSAVFIAFTAILAAIVAIALDSAEPADATAAAVAHALAFGLPAGTGLAVLARLPGDRFARALVALGLMWSITVLAHAPGSLPYSTGRVATWLAEAGVVYVMLAFPSGRLTDRAERAAWSAMVALIGVLYLPTALLVGSYPQPFEGHTCVGGCPGNAFQLTSSQPAVVDGVIRPVREVLTVAVFVLVAGILARRVARAGPMLRRALAPVAVTAALRALAFPVYFVVRRSQPESSALAVISWIEVMLVSLIPLGIWVGFTLRRLYGAAALRAMAGRVGADAGALGLRDAMASALEDPSLRIFARANGGWVDESAQPVGAPGLAAGRAVTEVAAEDRELAVIETDAALAHDRDVLRAAAAYATIVLENERLVGELLATVGDLSESRARIAAVADEVRRQIERDLHDGAQQRLIALRITLGRGAERLQADAPEAAALLGRLGEQTEATIDEVRALAHGIYPSLLADRGLPDALHAVVLSAPIQARLSVDHVGRYPPEVESTVYFACLEALQNAEKHAGAESRVEISVWENGALGFDVSDDGQGFDTTGPAGAGLTNLRDRITAVGGRVEIESRPGHGTLVRGRIPV